MLTEMILNASEMGFFDAAQQNAICKLDRQVFYYAVYWYG